MSGVIDRIKAGRTDLVFDYVSAGNPATAADEDGTTLVQWCAYYGDVSRAPAGSQRAGWVFRYSSR